MMKKYDKEGFIVFQYSFDTLYDFTTYIKKQQINSRIFREISSERSHTSWSGTETFDEAIELCQRGWSEDFDKLIRLKKQVDDKLLDSTQVVRQYRDFIGYSPSVADYLNGFPLNMWNSHNKNKPYFINIFINVAFSAGTSRSEVFNRGIILLSVIDALEEKGFGVRLTAFQATNEGREMILGFYNLKLEGERLNMRRAYFPMCHRSFHRRLNFRLFEITPVQNSYWGCGYGQPSYEDDVRKVLNMQETDILVSQPGDMGIDGDDIEDDLEGFLERTNLSDYFQKRG